MREHFSEKDRRKDLIRGCLLGVVIGDALGAPFEHLPAGGTALGLEATGGKVLDFRGSWNGPRGGWTDDKSLTLAACRCFLDAARTGHPIPSPLHRALWDAPAPSGMSPARAKHSSVRGNGLWRYGCLVKRGPHADRPGGRLCLSGRPQPG